LTIADDRDVPKLNKSVPGFAVAVNAVANRIRIENIAGELSPRKVNA